MALAYRQLHPATFEGKPRIAAMQENYLVGGQYQNNFSREENNQFAVIFDEITEKMIVAMEAGASFDSPQMQQAVQEHFDFCNRFWKPTAEAYKSLAMSYVLPTGYRDTYENKKLGLGKYIYDAVCHFADTRLSS
jgi:hypothetical protein